MTLGEQVTRHSPKRMKRDAKRYTSRARRRLERRWLQDAPVRALYSGWAD